MVKVCKVQKERFDSENGLVIFLKVEKYDKTTVVYIIWHDIITFRILYLSLILLLIKSICDYDSINKSKIINV